MLYQIDIDYGLQNETECFEKIEKFFNQKLNVIIKPSINKNKKIDVFSNSGNFISSIGDIRYNDYPSYCININFFTFIF